MVPNVKCPYGERKGATVFCKLANKTVNILVFPCTSPRYVNCRFYKQAEKKPEERAADTLESVTASREAVAEKPEKPVASGRVKPPPPGAKAEAERVESVVEEPSLAKASPDSSVVEESGEVETAIEKMQVTRVGEVESSYSLEEARRLLDPLFQASLILEHTPRSMTVSGPTINELARSIYLRLDSREKRRCFVVKTAKSPALFIKMCNGKVVAAAVETQGPLQQEDLGRPMFVGAQRVLIYGPLTE